MKLLPIERERCDNLCFVVLCTNLVVMIDICSCRGSCAPCPVMVKISCFCGETHFEVRFDLVWFYGFIESERSLC